MKKPLPEIKYIKHTYPNGIVSHERWGRNAYLLGGYEYLGKLHRVDGPALLDYNKKGQVTKWAWYFDGMPIPKDVIRKHFIDPLRPTPEEAAKFILIYL